MFKDAYRRRRCILPVDGFYEWRAIKGDPASGDWIRTFVMITTDANELVAQIHNRMPLILTPHEYKRWLGDDPDPRDLLRPFPAEPMARSKCAALDRRIIRSAQGDATCRMLMTMPGPSPPTQVREPCPSGLKPLSRFLDVQTQPG